MKNERPDAITCPFCGKTFHGEYALSVRMIDRVCMVCGHVWASRKGAVLRHDYFGKGIIDISEGFLLLILLCRPVQRQCGLDVVLPVTSCRYEIDFQRFGSIYRVSVPVLPLGLLAHVDASVVRVIDERFLPSGLRNVLSEKGSVIGPFSVV